MIALLGDIHGNLPALEAVLSDMPPVSEIWVLGDIIGELPYPCETIDRLISLGEKIPVLSITGNREVSLLEIRAGEHAQWRRGTQFSVLTWTADRLKPHHWQWLSALTPTLQGLHGKALLFHGSPREVRGRVLTAEAAREAIAGFPHDWYIGGHSHQARRFDVGGKTFINAGSVGLSLDGIAGVAGYALLDEKSPEPALSFRYVTYSTDKVVAQVKKTGLYDAAPGFSRAYELEMITGRHYVMSLLDHVHEYAKSRLGHPVTEIPPDLWMEGECLWDGSEWMPGRQQ